MSLRFTLLVRRNMTSFTKPEVRACNAVKARKLAYYGHTVRKQGNCLEKEIMQGTMPGARRRGRDKWRKYVRGVANPRIEDG